MTVARKTFIQARALDFFNYLGPEFMTLPFNIIGALDQFDNVRSATYRNFAKMHSIPVLDVALYAESNDGATHYDANTDRYIILYNDDAYKGRMRFTVAHELGHVFLKHLCVLSESKVAANNLFDSSYKVFEIEADRFASMVLCPFPVLRELNINSAAQIRTFCGLSKQASEIKLEQYSEWLKQENNKSWEHEIIGLFEPYIKTKKRYYRRPHS